MELLRPTRKAQRSSTAAEMKAAFEEPLGGLLPAEERVSDL